jgi:hypothetical protein
VYRLHENTIKQWDILEKQLAKEGRQYIALADRPTLADLSYFPFAMPWKFTFLGVDTKDWPHIEAWATHMLARPAIQDIMSRAKSFGHDMIEKAEAPFFCTEITFNSQQLYDKALQETATSGINQKSLVTF